MTKNLAFNSSEDIKNQCREKLTFYLSDCGIKQNARSRYSDGGVFAWLQDDIEYDEDKEYFPPSVYDRLREIGIPDELTFLIDTIFESLPEFLAKDFPLEVFDSIKPGKDLSDTFNKFMYWLLCDECHGVINHFNSEVGKSVLNSLGKMFLSKNELDDKYKSVMSMAWAERDKIRNQLGNEGIDLGSMYALQFSDLFAEKPYEPSDNEEWDHGIGNLEKAVKDAMARRWWTISNMLEELKETSKSLPETFGLMSAISSAYRNSLSSFDFQQNADSIGMGAESRITTTESCIRITLYHAARVRAWAASGPEKGSAWSYNWISEGKKALTESVIDQRNKILDLLTGEVPVYDTNKVCRVRSLMEQIKDDDNGAISSIAIFVKYFQHSDYHNKVQSYAYKLERSVAKQDMKYEVESLIKKRMTVYFEDDDDTLR